MLNETGIAVEVGSHTASQIVYLKRSKYLSYRPYNF